MGSKKIGIFLWKSTTGRKTKQKKLSKIQEAKKKTVSLTSSSISFIFCLFECTLCMVEKYTNRHSNLKLGKHRFQNLLPAIDKPHRTKMASCSISLSTCLPAFSLSEYCCFCFEYFLFGFVSSVGWCLWMRERWLADLQKKMQMPNAVDELNVRSFFCST